MFHFFKHAIKEEGDFSLFSRHPQLLALLMESVWDTYYQNVDSIKPDIADNPAGQKKEQKLIPQANPLALLQWNEVKMQELPYEDLFDMDDSLADQTSRLKVRPWLHLIYAYLIENTRVTQIFKRVIERYNRGEELNIIKEPGSRNWLFATEQLFFKDTPNFASFSLNSYLRPDLEASRRNAYYRMFGMDLNHGTEANQPYPYHKAQMSNKKFVAVFEKFLLEVWRGIQNASNTSGSNPTDEGTILNLVDELKDMMNDRRRYENLEQEEFFFVSMMSWFHMTLLHNTPIVVDLDAQANSPDDRLRKIGDKVGLPSHGKSKNLMELAEPLGLILTMIERGDFDSNTIKNLYIDTAAVPESIRDIMLRVITHWSIATGSDIKEGRLKSAA